MARWSRLVLVAVAAGGLALVPACGKKDTSNRPKVGIITNCVDPFWDLCEAGANKAAKDFDVDLVFNQPKSGDGDIQKPVIDAWVSQGFSGIGVSVIKPKEQTDDLRLVSKKLTLVTMDNDAPDSGRVCYVGVDNKEAGRAVGRLIKKVMPNGGTLALFIGSVTSENGQARPAGVLAELATADANGTPAKHPTRPELTGKQYGKFFLVDGEPKIDDMNKDKAAANASAMLSRLDGVPDVGLVGLYAYNPPTILEAVRAKNLVGKVKIVGFDENEETLKAIADGHIEGTVVQDPYNYGYKTVEILAAEARGDASKRVTGSAPYQVITREGGPEQDVNGLRIKFPKAGEYLALIREQRAAVKR